MKDKKPPTKPAWAGEENSQASRIVTPEEKALIKKRKRKFEEDQHAMEEWAAAGFTSGRHYTFDDKEDGGK